MLGMSSHGNPLCELSGWPPHSEHSLVMIIMITYCPSLYTEWNVARAFAGVMVMRVYIHVGCVYVYKTYAKCT